MRTMSMVVALVLGGCTAQAPPKVGDGPATVPEDGTPPPVTDPTDPPDPTDPTNPTDPTDPTTPPAPVDADGDGHTADVDCDDGDAAVYPGAAEIAADGIDQDCDLVDLCFEDRDGDGFGSTTTVAGVDLSCAATGEAVEDTDCDDSQPAMFPGNRDWCDGLDNDCADGPDPHCYLLGGADTVVTDMGWAAYAQAAGDFDHDGLDELMFGNVFGDLATLTDGKPAAGDVSYADWTRLTVRGGGFLECFGCTVDAGDIDGDGFADPIVGKPFVNEVYLWTDLLATEIPSPFFHEAVAEGATAIVEGDPDHDNLGFWWAGQAGDWNGDGVQDLAVGMTEDSLATESRYYLLSGPFEGTVSVLDAYAVIDQGPMAGASVAHDLVVRDFDGDGVDDLFVDSAGLDQAYLFYGPITGDLEPADADVTFLGPSGTDFGEALGAGDFDGDGELDVAIGAPGGAGGTGAVFVVHAPFAALIDVTVDADFVLSGGGTSSSALAIIESRLTTVDLDGDGADDLIAPARWAGLGGEIAVMFGPNMDGSWGDLTLAQADMHFATTDPIDLFGYAVDWVDLDGDGAHELVAGAPGGGKVGIWDEATLFP